MILVIGATGSIGAQVVQQLHTRGVPLRAFVRNSTKARRILNADIEIVQGDLALPDTIDAALDQVERIFLVTSNSSDQLEYQKNVVDAALRAGTVQHIVKISGGSYVSADTQLPIGQVHWQIEQYIAQSGIPYTFLRPSFFMQNMLKFAAPQVAKRNRFLAPMKHARISMVDVRDIASVAVAVLTEEGHSGKIYEITGPEALTFREVAQILSALLQRRVTYRSVPLWLYRMTARLRGEQSWEVEHNASLIEKVLLPGLGGKVTNSVSEMTHKEPISFKQFAGEYLYAFQATAPERPAIQRLGHLAIFVTDIARSRTFYEDVLGLHFVEMDDPTTAPGARMTNQTLYFMSCGTNHHDLVLVQQCDHKGNSMPVAQDDWLHVSFALDPELTLATFMQKLQCRGIEYTPGSVLHGLGVANTCQAVYFRDPDDHMIEVYSNRQEE